MGIDLFGSEDIGMPKPFGDILHWDALMSKQGSAAMSKIMETDSSHAVIVQKSSEGTADPVRMNKVSVFEQIDIVFELIVVTRAEEDLHLLLTLLHLQKLVYCRIAKRKSSEGASILGGILHDKLILAVNGSLDNGVFDGHRLILEVDGIPFKTAHLFSSQTIISSHVDGEFKIRPFGYLK